MSKECTTHHHACDCREEKFKQLERENAALRSDLSKCNNLSEIRRDAFYDEKSARWAMVDRMRELEQENAALRELAARMATEMREVDHEFASLQDYDAARKEAKP